MTWIESRAGFQREILTRENAGDAVLLFSTAVLFTFLAFGGRDGFRSSLRRQVRKEQESRCLKCGNTFKPSKLQTHHILPRSLGGADTRINAVVLCTNCHERADIEALYNGVLMNGMRIADVQREAPALIQDMRLYREALARFPR